MDYYHIWCDLKAGVAEADFCEAIEHYLGALRASDLIRGHRLTRRKLGLGPEGLGEFHIAIEVNDLGQLEEVFRHVARRQGPTERLHQAVYSRVQNLKFALYRDFPDVLPPESV